MANNFAQCGKPLVAFAGFYISEIKSLHHALDTSGLTNNMDICEFPFANQQKSYSTAYSLELAKSILSYIKKTLLRTDKTTYCAPSNIFLIYCTAGNDKIFANEFYRCFKLMKFDRNGDNSTPLCKKLIAILQSKRNMSIDFLGRDNEKLLPLRNFYFKKNISIDSYCKDNSYNFPCNIKKEKIPSKLPKRAFKDYRENYFDIADESHGQAYMDNETALNNILHFIEDKYRFGCPIRTGHHYHVFQNTGYLKEMPFYCTTAEQTFIPPKDCQYLNISSNDSVRE